MQIVRCKKSKIKGKVIIITGASSGIGRSLAYKLAPHEVKLVLNARRENMLKKVAKNIVKFGSEASTVVGDIRDEEVQDRIVLHALEKYGHIDVLVNNAGLGKAARLLEQLDVNIDEMIDTNLKALIKMTKKILRPMIANHSGHIINISTSLVYLPNKILSIYIATKAGVKSFSDSIRNELCDYGIKVSVVLPGPYNTQFHTVAGFNDIKYYCYNVEKLAEKLVKLIQKPKKVLIAPTSYNLLVKMVHLLPFLRNTIIKKIEKQIDSKIQIENESSFESNSSILLKLMQKNCN